NQRSRQQVPEQTNTDSKYSTGVKSGIRLARRNSGTEPGLPGIDPPVGKPVHQPYNVDRQQQYRGGNCHVKKTREHATESAQFRFRAQASNDAPDSGQQLVGGTAKEE